MGVRPETVRLNAPRALSATPLSGVLAAAIDRMDSAPRIRESLALAYWARVVGPQAAAATRAESVRDGVLVVRTRSSEWSHELTFHRTTLIRSLNRILGGEIITRIVFRAQGIAHEEPQLEQPDVPPPQELAAVMLEPGEKEELRARLEALFDAIPDDRVRTSIATRLTVETKLRHWRLERGWHVCPRCTAIHRTEGAICPICRLRK